MITDQLYKSFRLGGSWKYAWSVEFQDAVSFINKKWLYEKWDRILAGVSMQMGSSEIIYSESKLYFQMQGHLLLIVLPTIQVVATIFRFVYLFVYIQQLQIKIMMADLL